MILEILNKNYELLLIHLFIVVLTWIVVVFAIGIDLYFGIKKSKQEGLFTHSYGLRKTTEKCILYLAMMFFMFFIDFLNPIWAYFDLVALPLASIFGAMVLVYTEWKSVRENANEKFRNKLQDNTAEILNFIRENREEITALKNELKRKEDEVIN